MVGVAQSEAQGVQEKIEMKHLTVRIFGDVQGVGFRFWAKQCADELGIKGFARNEKDGSVCVEAEGESSALEEFVARCRKGPPFACVERVSTEEGALRGYEGFEIN